MIVGFTGTRKGMTTEQKQVLMGLLLQRAGDHAEFWHGNEAHSDSEAALMASELGYRTVAWPSDLEGTQGDFVSDESMPPLPPLIRNKTIASSCEVLIATPSTDHEVQRSGTWATVRYARDLGKTVFIVKPSGLVRLEEQA